MSVYAQAVKLLAPRDHFRAELAFKLGRRGYDEDEVDATLDRLEREGMIDDRQTAARYVRAKLRGTPLGRRRLEAELRRKGVDGAVVRATLEEELPDDERAHVEAAAERWLANRAPDRAKRARYLERRGFAPADIFAVLPERDAMDG